MKFLYLISLITSLSLFETHAFTFKNINKVHFQLGSWLENYQQVQATSSGETNGFVFTPYIALALDYKLKESLYLIPELGYVLQRTSDEVSKNHFFIRTDIAYKYRDWLRLRAGSSLMILSYSGDGGEKSLPNGNSTQAYYIPEQRRTAYNQSLDLGLEFIHQQTALKLQSYIYAWNEEKERMTTYSISFNYFISLEDFL